MYLQIFIRPVLFENSYTNHCALRNMLKAVLIFCAVYAECAKNLPSFIEPCYRNDPKAGECLLRNVRSLKPRLEKGIPELQLPNLNPLLISTAPLFSSGDFRGNMTDLKLYDVSNSETTYIDINFHEKVLVVEYTMTSMRMVTNYRLVGKLLMFQLDSTGELKANITGLRMKYTGYLKMVQRRGVEYLALNGSEAIGNIEYIHVEFTNLFKDNELLNRAANDVLNDNYKIIINDFGPVINRSCKIIIDTILAGLFYKYPADVLFPVKK
ncbi:unnamed protein product [Phyllotreta striolata]|uniref:Protein takeout n=1 Tax=Phyllotreta striolata TaxID=444603 RepID=A0A9N9TXJ5_PHYSR|nr:unnamed protein product [Phyllotreta striolata]